MAAPDVKQLLDTALGALHRADDWQSVLDALPVPVYTTSSDGTLTYFNQACTAAVGREPRLGEDRWCVSWQLYTTSGEPLPHSDCPMARAINERREVRNEIIIVERPDRSRIACRPYPTPYFDDSGELKGAVNLLIDVTEEQADTLTEQSRRCRRLARSTNDVQASAILADMAQDYAATAAALKSA